MPPGCRLNFDERRRLLHAKPRFALESELAAEHSGCQKGLAAELPLFAICKSCKSCWGANVPLVGRFVLSARDQQHHKLVTLRLRGAKLMWGFIFAVLGGVLLAQEVDGFPRVKDAACDWVSRSCRAARAVCDL